MPEFMMTITASPTPFKPVSKPDAAELLGVSTKTIDNYIRAGSQGRARQFVHGKPIGMSTKMLASGNADTSESNLLNKR